MPAAPLSEPLIVTRYKGEVWRLVEAQHRGSTLKLTDSLDEQALLVGEGEVHVSTARPFRRY